MAEAPVSSSPEPQPGSTARRPPVDVRRLITVLAVIAGGLAYFFWDDIRDVLGPAKIIECAVPKEALLAANEIRVPSGPGYPMDITFTRIGGAITRLTWTAPGGHVEELVSQDKVANRALLVTLAGREKDGEEAFTVEGPIDAVDERGLAWKEVRFVKERPGQPRVEKTFRIYSADRPVNVAPIELLVKVEDIPEDDPVRKKGYTLLIANAFGVPSDLGKDDGQITVRSDNVAGHRAVRRISGVEEWPTEEEKKRAGHGRLEAPVSLEWVATGTRYFGLIVRPKDALTDAEMRFARTARTAASVELQVPAPAVSRIRDTFFIYAGPKDYGVLAALPGRQQEAIDYWYLGRPVTVLLKLVHDRVVANYGVAIILVTVVFRVLMWPVTSYNLRAMVEIKIANAKLAEIDAREPPRSDAAARVAWVKEARPWEDRQRKATIGVFLPMVILLPALLILYHALNVGYEFWRQPLALWITDISRRDPFFVLPVLMGLATMGQMRTMSEDPSKDRTWLWMSVGITVLFAFFSAGLVLFWLTDALVGWFQLGIIKRSKRRSGG